MEKQTADILSIADLLEEFVQAEKEILNQHHIKHPTTIGSMYEGLTEAVLNNSIFDGLGLKVIKNSFIKGNKTEFDIMLVEGKGSQIPYSERYEYNPEQVIAVIQVKKKLFSKDIKEGFANLQFIVDHYHDVEPEPFMIRLLRDGFRAICNKDITARELDELNITEEGIYRTLVVESKLPVRILWGYNGFSSEFKFRESFLEYLAENTTNDTNNIIGGFGPHNFPNLIICGKYTMMKQNGMPSGTSLAKDNWWHFYTSSSYNPTYFFLELIWTRLSYKYQELSMDIFGEDLTMEPVKRFLDCRIGRNLKQKKNGALFINEWIPNYHNRKNLNDTMLFNKKYKRFEINSPWSYSRFYIYRTDTILPYSMYRHAEKDYKGRLERIDTYNKKENIFVTLQILPRKTWDIEANEVFKYNRFLSSKK